MSFPSACEKLVLEFYDQLFQALIAGSVVKSGIKTNSPIPPWAEDQVVEAWNVPTL
jgi:hypothetical protein